MSSPAQRSRLPRLLAAHPELRSFMEQSATFRRIEERSRIEIDGTTHYRVRGDTLGDREDLFVDALCRGALPAGADPLSRALFGELPPDLQAVIRAHVRREPANPSGRKES